MIYRLAIGVLGAVAVAIIPCPRPCDPPTKCLTNTPQGQAGLRALRSAQRRRQFPAGAALSSTARAVPERCGGLVWRRPRRCESHAREPYDESYGPDES